MRNLNDNIIKKTTITIDGINAEKEFKEQFRKIYDKFHEGKEAANEYSRYKTKLSFDLLNATSSEFNKLLDFTKFASGLKVFYILNSVKNQYNAMVHTLIRKNMEIEELKAEELKEYKIKAKEEKKERQKQKKKERQEALLWRLNKQKEKLQEKSYKC